MVGGIHMAHKSKLQCHKLKPVSQPISHVIPFTLHCIFQQYVTRGYSIVVLEK